MTERRSRRPARKRPLAAATLLLALSALAAAVPTVTPAPAYAADSCLPAARAACSPNSMPMPLNEPRRLTPPQKGLSAQLTGQPLAAQPPAAQPSAAQPAAQATAGTALTAKPRPVRLRLRERPAPLRRLDQRLLLREISNVRRLLRQTPQDTAEHARTLRRLAESYVELAESAKRRYARSMRMVGAVEAINPPRAQLYRRRASKAASQERRSRLKAVQLYRKLLSEHPHYCRFAGHFDPRRRSCGDEVLRYLAHELELLHEPERAQQSYRVLLRRWPGSAHAPVAALALAEAKFDAARHDHGLWPQAQKAYRAALRYPHPDRGLKAYTIYKLGHAHWSVGQYDEALAALARSIRVLAPAAKDAGPATSGARATASHARPAHNDLQARALLEASRRDLVTVYGLSGDPAQAAAFFAPLSGDAPGSSTRTQAMVLSLGKAMLRMGQLDAAAMLYQQLAAQTQDLATRCSYQAVVSRAYSATRADAPGVTANALSSLHDTLKQARKAGDAQATAHCRSVLLEAGGETAMAWHTETLGTKHAAGTGNTDTIAAALRVFGWLAPLSHKQSTLHYAHGELLLASQHHGECAEAFSAAFGAAPKGARGADAALAASRCWLLQHPDNAQLGPEHMAMGTPKQVGREALGRLQMYEQVACRIQPPAQDGQPAIEHAAIANLRTRIYLDQGRLDAATATQREIALGSANSLAGLHATRAYLRGMELLQQQDPLPQCSALVKQDSAALRARHCDSTTPAGLSAADRKMRAQLCRTLSHVSR